MQNPEQKLSKGPVFSRNQEFCLKNLKLWRTATTVKLNIFCWSFPRVSHLQMSKKQCPGFFWFCLDLDFVSTH